MYICHLLVVIFIIMIHIHTYSLAPSRRSEICEV